MPHYDMYAGLSGLSLAEESFDLGEGVTLSRTYAHLMAPFIMAFKRPADFNQPHPGPWKDVGRDFAFEIVAEIRIPADTDERLGLQMEIGRMIGILLRLGVHPDLRIPVWANYSFSTMAERPVAETWLRLNEYWPRYFLLDAPIEDIGPTQAAWIAERWPTALRLARTSAEFELAIDAFDIGQFVQRPTLALVSLWAALESLFSPSKSELRFRVSALIAAYLEPPGPARHDLQGHVAKLYDARSAAAHGTPRPRRPSKKDESDEVLLDTFNLLGRVLRKMLDEKAVPSKDSLERALFGV